MEGTPTTRTRGNGWTRGSASGGGVADLRGDGRPDYRYHAHVLYGDSVSPSRARVGGGAITVQGTGFAPGLAVIVAAAAAKFGNRLLLGYEDGTIRLVQLDTQVNNVVHETKKLGSGEASVNAADAIIAELGQ